MSLTPRELLFFFFQAEDGIRDYKVTGVQTCALPIWFLRIPKTLEKRTNTSFAQLRILVQLDRKSTRLNSSHLVISYAVFCLKKKKTKHKHKYKPRSLLHRVSAT